VEFLGEMHRHHAIDDDLDRRLEAYVTRLTALTAGIGSAIRHANVAQPTTPARSMCNRGALQERCG